MSEKTNQEEPVCVKMDQPDFVFLVNLGMCISGQLNVLIEQNQKKIPLTCEEKELAYEEGKSLIAREYKSFSEVYAQIQR